MLLFLQPESVLSVLIAGSLGLPLFLYKDWHYGATTVAGEGGGGSRHDDNKILNDNSREIVCKSQNPWHSS